MLTRIRNAGLIKSPIVYVLQTNMTLSIVKILKQEGFIDSYEIDVTYSNLKCLCINLRYKDLNRQKFYITKMIRISKPGLRVYKTSSSLSKILGGIGVAIFVFREIYFVYFLKSFLLLVFI